MRPVKSDNYIKGQLVEKIAKMKMLTPKGELYIENNF